MDCEGAVRRVYHYLDGELTVWKRRAITRHLDECPPCAQGFYFEIEIRRVIATRCRDEAPEPTAPPDRRGPRRDPAEPEPASSPSPGARPRCTVAVEPLWGAQVKSAIRKAAGAGMLAAHDAAWSTASPAMASTGATLAEAQPWHYWIASCCSSARSGIVLIALPDRLLPARSGA